MAKQPQYGFRHDPMRFVESDRSLQGARVRTFVFAKPKRGDRKAIQAEIDKILAGQLADGRLDGHPKHGYQFTAGKLIRLAEMGCPAGRAEVKKAVAAILGKRKPNQADPYGIYDVRAFCLLGLGDQAKFRTLAESGLKRIVAREAEWSDLSEGCPWTPIEHLITLWHGREVAGTEACVAKAMKWIAAGLNPAGCLSFKDPCPRGAGPRRAARDRPRAHRRAAGPGRAGGTARPARREKLRRALDVWFVLGYSLFPVGSRGVCSGAGRAMRPRSRNRPKAGRLGAFHGRCARRQPEESGPAEQSSTRT